MEQDDYYSASKTMLVTDDKFSQMGGWLRFYQVINIITIVFTIGLVMLISTLYILEQYQQSEIQELYWNLLEILPAFLLSLLVLKYLHDRGLKTPRKIVSLMGYYVIVSIAINALLYYQFKNGNLSEKPSSIFGDVIYYLIWSNYFKKSKRVNIYFGANAN